MTFIFKQYPFSVAVICVIFYLSLFPMPQTEMDDIPFIDKWVHICMYAGLSGIIWIEYIRAHQFVRFAKAVWPACVLPLAISGTLELLQAYCTTTRNGDWLDMAANSIGVVVGTAISYFLIRPFLMKWKKKKY